MGKTGGNGVTARRSVAAPAPSQPVHEEPAPPPVPSPPPGRTWAGVAIIATGIFLGLVGLGIWGSFESAAAY